MHQTATLTAVLDACRPQPGNRPNILKSLLTIQQHFGHVPISAVPQVARLLGVTEAEVSGVLSYYPDLRTDPPGRHVVRVCTGESCFANGCANVYRAIEELARDRSAGTGADPRFTVEKISCVGNCALSPTVVVDHDVYGRVEPSHLPSLLERYR